MAAPIGNKFWLMRSSYGRKPTFDPESLWKAAQEYFEYVDQHPLYETKAFAYQGDITLQEIPKMRAMTQVGLCLFLGISEETYRVYSKQDGYIEVTREINKTIRSQKFEGAAAELLNANIIARDLGLVDKKETKATLAWVDPEAMTREQMQDELDDLSDK